MLRLDTTGMYFVQINEWVRSAGEHEVVLDNCMGQRYLGCGSDEDLHLVINGTAGNASGAYLNGAKLIVNGNAQDAIGDTMNAGEIIIHGNAGDAIGYAMRGGKIFVQGNTGYRAGIHMKAYKNAQPKLVVGGGAGSFLGEYLAGGTIVVLGLGCDSENIVGRFTGTGMHGGKIFLRTEKLPDDLPAQVHAALADEADLAEIEPLLAEYCKLFGTDRAVLSCKPFYVLTPNSANPYQQLYVYN